MSIVRVQPLALEGLHTVTFQRFHDDRGYFTELFRLADFTQFPELSFAQKTPFVQMNQSYSKKGVMRGLHTQWNPFQGKLIRTVCGHMVDLALDIRLQSPTFGKIIAFDMPSHPEDDTNTWIWLPPGFAHGNYFLEETTIEYLCTGEYSHGSEAGISPLSADIDWSLCDPSLKTQFDSLRNTAVLSEKDKNGFSLTQWKETQQASLFTYPMK